MSAKIKRPRALRRILRGEPPTGRQLRRLVKRARRTPGEMLVETWRDWDDLAEVLARMKYGRWPLSLHRQAHQAYRDIVRLLP